jgi:hypothetical protein
VLVWPSPHPRWTFYFVPTSASWLNAVEKFFSGMTRQCIRMVAFAQFADLRTAMSARLVEHNVGPKLFVWAKPAEEVLATLNRVPAAFV